VSITVELTYDMAKALGTPQLQLEGAATVADAVRLARERFSEGDPVFDQLSRVTALAVNGVLVNYRKGMRTRLADGDVVAFVKAAAGG
jgi:molybdopterin converting factor small subunit